MDIQYDERPGTHNWDFWNEELPIILQYFRLIPKATSGLQEKQECQIKEVWLFLFFYNYEFVSDACSISYSASLSASGCCFFKSMIL